MYLFTELRLWKAACHRLHIDVLCCAVCGTDQAEQGLCLSEQHQTASSQTGGAESPHYTWEEREVGEGMSTEGEGTVWMGEQIIEAFSHDKHT